MKYDDADKQGHSAYSDLPLGIGGENNHKEEPRDRDPHHEYSTNGFRHYILVTWDWIRLGWKKTNFHERTMIFLTLIYVFATISYVVVSISTLRAINTSGETSAQQMGEMIKAANIQARAAQKIADASDRSAIKIADAVDAMGRNADAAKSSADTAKQILAFSNKQFEIEQRPYLYFAPSDLNSILPSKFWGKDVPVGGLAINIGMVNGGRTPAVEFRGAEPIMIVTSDAKDPTIGMATHIGTGETIATSVPGIPGRVSTAYNVDYISAKELEEIRTSKRFIFVVGAAEYASQYDRKHLYCASFCFRYNPVGLPFRPCTAPVTSCEMRGKHK